MIIGKALGAVAAVFAFINRILFSRAEKLGRAKAQLEQAEAADDARRKMADVPTPTERDVSDSLRRRDY